MYNFSILIFLAIMFATIILISIIASLIYLKFYKTKINARLITNEGKKLPEPITITIITVFITFIISFILLFILIATDAFSSPVQLPSPIVGYEYYSYEEIKPNMQASIYKPHLDNEEIIPGYELIETNEIDDFKYYLYINKEKTNNDNFIIFIKYLGVEIPLLDSMFGIYTKETNSSKYTGYSSAGAYSNAYFVKGFTEKKINLKIIIEHRIIKTIGDEKDIDNYELYAKFEKEFLLTP